MELTHEDARDIIAGLYLDLRHVPEFLHDQALKAWIDRNASRFLETTDRRMAAPLLFDNLDLMDEDDDEGFVADLIVTGWTMSTFFHQRFRYEWAELFDIVDRGPLVEAGDPIPAGPWPRTLFRGAHDLGGYGAGLDGFSWTWTKSVAETFAIRRGRNLVVLERGVDLRDVLFYCNQRNEDEYVLAVG